ncbi:hypothetical protein TcBrA4_0061030 [Trypanosoma cruzi]|nr:hypothetical protein TcBrA4_0061030 [Trypanosoma cruzi]
MIDSNPEALTSIYARKLSHFALVYLHNTCGGGMANQQIGDVVAWVRGSYSGCKNIQLALTIFEEADQQIREGKVDAVGFWKAQVHCDPDFVERAQRLAPQEPRPGNVLHIEQQSDTRLPTYNN